MTTDPALPSSAELDKLDDQMRALRDSADDFGRAISRSLSQGLAHGKSFEDVLKSIGQRFVEIGLNAAFKPLEKLFDGMLNGFMEGMFKGGGSGGGGSPPTQVTPFADGGVIAAPTFFPMGKSLGLAGERGAEAIMPLARGPDGKLGVASQGGGRGTSVVINIATPDVAGFRQSETQVAATIARALARGQRGL